MREVLLVSVGGLLGANVRYLVSAWAAGRFGASFPFGTLLVNVAGSFLMGLLIGVLSARVGGEPAARLLLATGFLGAETTFSTFAYETAALGRAGARGAAARNVLANVAGGLAAAAAGLALASALTGTAPW